MILETITAFLSVLQKHFRFTSTLAPAVLDIYICLQFSCSNNTVIFSSQGVSSSLPCIPSSVRHKVDSCLFVCFFKKQMNTFISLYG